MSLCTIVLSCNCYILQRSRSKAMFWSSSRLVAQGYNADSEDGLHAGKVALTWVSVCVCSMFTNTKTIKQDFIFILLATTDVFVNTTTNVDFSG